MDRVQKRAGLVQESCIRVHSGGGFRAFIRAIRGGNCLRGWRDGVLRRLHTPDGTGIVSHRSVVASTRTSRVESGSRQKGDERSCKLLVPLGRAQGKPVISQGSSAPHEPHLLPCGQHLAPYEHHSALSEYHLEPHEHHLAPSEQHPAHTNNTWRHETSRFPPGLPRSESQLVSYQPGAASLLLSTPACPGGSNDFLANPAVLGHGLRRSGTGG